MSEHKLFSVKIIIGDKEMKEYWLNNQCYVPINLHTKDSYMIEVELDDAENDSKLEGKVSTQGQRYPVTPFKIQVKKNIIKPCWVSVEMDGEHICNQLLQFSGPQTRLIDGRKYGNEIRELAFSLPLLTQQVTGAKQNRIDAAGSITVKLLEAIHTGTETFTPAVKIKTNYLPEGNFPQLSKQDISQKENLGAVVREGRTFLKLSYNNGEPRVRTRYTRGKTVDKITLHYRPLESLLDLGVITPEEYSSLKASMVAEVEPMVAEVEPIVPKDNLQTNNGAEQVLKTVKNETATVSLPIVGPPPVSLPTVGPPPVSLPIASTPLKQELTITKKEGVTDMLLKEESKGDEMTSNFGQMKLEVQDSADDIIYLDTEDDVIYLGHERCAYTGDESVICMGDDSCYAFDVTPQEISMVDLTEDAHL